MAKFLFSDEFVRLRATLQILCTKLMDEFLGDNISNETVSKILDFTKSEPIDKNLTSAECHELYRIICATASLLMKDAMKDKEQMNYQALAHCLSIICNILKVIKYEDAEDWYSMFWITVSRCVLLGDKITIATIELEKTVKCASFFINFMLSHPTTKEELYSKEHRGELSFIIMFLLKKFCSDAVDLPIRLIIGDSLLGFVKPQDVLNETITAFFPGIFCRLIFVANGDLNTTIVLTALNILRSTIIVCFNNVLARRRSEVTGAPLSEDNSKNNPKNNRVENNGDIYDVKSIEQIKLMITKLSSGLVARQDYRIRLSLLAFLYDIHRHCNVILGVHFDNLLTDFVLMTLNDPYEEIKALSEKVKNYLLQTGQENFVNALKERLYSLSSTIPTEAVVKGDIEGCLKQLLGVLQILKFAGNSCLLGGKLPEQLTFALSTVFRLNVKRLRLSREVIGDNDVLEVLDTLPFFHDIEKKTVLQIATVLVQNTHSHVFMNCVSEYIARSKRAEEITESYLFVAYLLRAANLNAIKLNEQFVDAMQVLVEQAVNLLEKVDIHRPPRDDFIEDDYGEQGAESCMVTVLLIFCTATFTCAPSVFLCQKLMLETLFELFKWTKSSYVMCAESAENALKAAALASKESDVSSLCVTYGKYLLPKVAICSRNYSSHLRTPCVLSSLLDHCNSSVLYPNTQYVVEELLFAVDIGSQEWLILILRAMLSFVKAVGKWFPDVRPQEIEFYENDPDKKISKPAFVEAVNNVLKRTKHLLFSTHMPIRLLLLKIIDACLKDLQHFPDDHLPMIHENWPAVLDCLRDKNLNVRVEGFEMKRMVFNLPLFTDQIHHQEAESGSDLPSASVDESMKLQLSKVPKYKEVVITMCEISGSFCYRRVIFEAWPPIRKFMLSRCAESANAGRAYCHSATYKFQKIVLENLGNILRQIEARQEDWKSAMEMAELYCDASQPKIFQNASRNLLCICEAKMKEDVEIDS